MLSEKNASVDKEPLTDISTGAVEPLPEGADAEFDEVQIFKQVKDGVNFRTVGRKKASVIFLKGKFSYAPA